jgi:hypothetical protein
MQQWVEGFYSGVLAVQVLRTVPCGVEGEGEGEGQGQGQGQVTITTEQIPVPVPVPVSVPGPVPFLLQVGSSGQEFGERGRGKRVGYAVALAECFDIARGGILLGLAWFHLSSKEATGKACMRRFEAVSHS